MSGIEGVMAEINSPRPGGRTTAVVPLTSAEEQYPLQTSEFDPNRLYGSRSSRTGNVSYIPAQLAADLPVCGFGRTAQLQGLTS